MNKCKYNSNCGYPEYGCNMANKCREAYQQGRADREAEIVTIIEQMKESATAMMWTEREVACEKILEQIKEQKNE